MKETSKWSEVFKLDGQRVAISREPEGWLIGSVPLSGSPVGLLRRQTGILSPAKVAAGITLRAEMPVKKEVQEDFGAVRSYLQYGLKVIEGGDGSLLRETFNGENPAQRLTEYFLSSPWECSQEGGGFLLKVETDFLAQKIEAKVNLSSVLMHTDLVRLRNPEPVSMNALSHFLLALNSRLRLARGSLLEDRVVLEVVIPASTLTPWLVDKAVGSLIAGFRMAKRECALLLEPGVAKVYCEFHGERR